MTLTAIKSFRYNTRRLMAGDEFEPVKPIHGRLLIAAKKAKAIRDPGTLTAPPPMLARKVAKAKMVKREADPTEQAAEPAAADPLDQYDDLTAARAEYHAAVGKRPFHGWDAETLREKVAEAGADVAPAAEIDDE